MREADAVGAWHADGEVLAAYRDGRLDTAGRWSVEAHLTSCAACRLQAGALVDPAQLRRLRATLIEAVDVPRTGMVERLLVRLGVADHTARLLAATPALRGSWLLAVAATLAFAVLAACSLALATTVEPLRAIGFTAGAWVVAVVVTVMPPAPSSVLFAAAGQLGFATLALLAATVVLLRRGRFESDRGFDTAPRFAARRLR